MCWCCWVVNKLSMYSLNKFSEFTDLCQSETPCRPRAKMSMSWWADEDHAREKMFSPRRREDCLSVECNGVRVFWYLHHSWQQVIHQKPFSQQTLVLSDYCVHHVLILYIIIVHQKYQIVKRYLNISWPIHFPPPFFIKKKRITTEVSLWLICWERNT